jgi:hypothetical protein
VKDHELEQASWPTMSDIVQTGCDLRSAIYQDQHSYLSAGDHS